MTLRQFQRRPDNIAHADDQGWPQDHQDRSHQDPQGQLRSRPWRQSFATSSRYLLRKGMAELIDLSTASLRIIEGEMSARFDVAGKKTRLAILAGGKVITSAIDIRGSAVCSPGLPTTLVRDSSAGRMPSPQSGAAVSSGALPSKRGNSCVASRQRRECAVI